MNLPTLRKLPAVVNPPDTNPPAVGSRVYSPAQESAPLGVMCITNDAALSRLVYPAPASPSPAFSPHTLPDWIVSTSMAAQTVYCLPGEVQ